MFCYTIYVLVPSWFTTWTKRLNPFSANFTIDHFVGLALKGLKNFEVFFTLLPKVLWISLILFWCSMKNMNWKKMGRFWPKRCHRLENLWEKYRRSLPENSDLRRLFSCFKKKTNAGKNKIPIQYVLMSTFPTTSTKWLSFTDMIRVNW